MPAEVSEGKSTQAPPLPPPAVESADVIPPAPAAKEPPGGDALRCANCLTPLAGPYCSQCGQHVADYHRSVWRFLGEFFENTFCWDNKLLRTLGPLFKRPGWLTQEFMAGRRVRYVHPLRLFLFTSAVCLTLLQFNHGFNKSRHRSARNPKPGVSVQFNDDDNDETADDKKRAASPPSASVSPPPASSPAAAGSPVTPPSASPAPDDGKTGRINPLEQALRDTIGRHIKDQRQTDPHKDDEITRRIETAAQTIEKKAGTMKPLDSDIQSKASWVAFAMLPIFAWLMRLTYGRRGGFFFAYLVFSLHYHTFLLLFWTAFTWTMTLVQAVHLFWLGMPLLIGFLVPPWYLYLSLKRFYGESRARTAAKTFAIGGLHLLAIVIGTTIAGVGANLTIK